MSLILDALRKSEAERRRGQAPSLYSGLPLPSARRQPGALRFLPWVVVAVLVLVALFAFRPDDSPATKAELSASGDAGDTAASLPSPAVDDGSATAIASTGAPPSPVIVAAPPASAPLPPTPSVDALVMPGAAPASPPAPTLPAAASQPVLAPPPAAAAPATAASGDEELPSVAVLDAATRNALPALKLSMHFYNSDPERRFAIIDGHRVTEGSELGGAVVTQIRRDGVVLDVSGQRVLLPRP